MHCYETYAQLITTAKTAQVRVCVCVFVCVSPHVFVSVALKTFIIHLHKHEFVACKHQHEAVMSTKHFIHLSLILIHQ